MNVVRKQENITSVVDLVHNIGNTDYVSDGEIIKNAPMKVVLVSSSSDLSLLDDYEPGTVACTAGFASMWQKAPDGTWAEMNL